MIRKLKAKKPNCSSVSHLGLDRSDFPQLQLESQSDSSDCHFGFLIAIERSQLDFEAIYDYRVLHGSLVACVANFGPKLWTILDTLGPWGGAFAPLAPPLATGLQYNKDMWL